MHTEIIKNHSPLHRTVWRFGINYRFEIWLNHWRDERRETECGKFRFSQDEGTAWFIASSNNRIPRPDIPLDIRAEALAGFGAKIRFAEGEV